MQSYAKYTLIKTFLMTHPCSAAAVTACMSTLLRVATAATDPPAAAARPLLPHDDPSPALPVDPQLLQVTPPQTPAKSVASGYEPYHPPEDTGEECGDCAAESAPDAAPSRAELSATAWDLPPERSMKYPLSTEELKGLKFKMKPDEYVHAQVRVLLGGQVPPRRRASSLRL